MFKSRQSYSVEIEYRTLHMHTVAVNSPTFGESLKIFNPFSRSPTQRLGSPAILGFSVTQAEFVERCASKNHCL